MCALLTVGVAVNFTLQLKANSYAKFLVGLIVLLSLLSDPDTGK
jgi:hypothetical protein